MGCFVCSATFVLPLFLFSRRDSFLGQIAMLFHQQSTRSVENLVENVP